MGSRLLSFGTQPVRPGRNVPVGRHQACVVNSLRFMRLTLGSGRQRLYCTQQVCFHGLSVKSNDCLGLHAHRSHPATSPRTPENSQARERPLSKRIELLHTTTSLALGRLAAHEWLGSFRFDSRPQTAYDDISFASLSNRNGTHHYQKQVVAGANDFLDDGIIIVREPGLHRNAFRSGSILCFVSNGVGPRVYLRSTYRGTISLFQGKEVGMSKLKRFDGRLRLHQ